MLLLALVVSVGGATLLSSAATASAAATKDKTVTVVKEEVRGSFGEILTNKKSHALYIDTSPPCTGGCIVSWPPLLMPKGTTVPAGAPDLGTTPFGSDRLQVTYKGQPLYTYWRDTKKSVLGNGCGGFYVATVSSSAPLH
jgi:predicted lipoprotein with Yx(FWY)xxD motif